MSGWIYGKGIKVFIPSILSRLHVEIILILPHELESYILTIYYEEIRRVLNLISHLWASELRPKSKAHFIQNRRRAVLHMHSTFVRHHQISCFLFESAVSTIHSVRIMPIHSSSVPLLPSCKHRVKYLGVISLKRISSSALIKVEVQIHWVWLVATPKLIIVVQNCRTLIC